MNENNFGFETIKQTCESVKNKINEYKERLNSIYINKKVIFEYMKSYINNWKESEVKIWNYVSANSKANYFIDNWKSPFAIYKKDINYVISFDNNNEKVQEELEQGVCIKEFINIYKSKEINKIIEAESDYCGLVEISKKYFNNIKHDLAKYFNKENYASCTMIYNEIRKYIMMNLHDKFFSEVPSLKDKEFLIALAKVKEIKPKSEVITAEILEYNFWDDAIKSIYILIYRIKKHGIM